MNLQIAIISTAMINSPTANPDTKPIMTYSSNATKDVKTCHNNMRKSAF